MAVFNTPSDVSTGTNLTASLWNDQLGTNGSLKYLYDTQNTVIANALSRNVILRKSTNTVLAAAGNADIAFDTIYVLRGIEQNNFPITTPVTAVPFPQIGMYLATFSMRYTVASTITVKFTVSDGLAVDAQQNQVAYLANGNIISTAILTSATLTSTVTINVTSSAAGTITAASPSSTVDGNMMLRIIKLNAG
jgi:hypothetical protein